MIYNLRIQEMTLSAVKRIINICIANKSNICTVMKKHSPGSRVRMLIYLQNNTIPAILRDNISVNLDITQSAVKDLKRRQRFCCCYFPNHIPPNQASCTVIG